MKVLQVLDSVGRGGAEMQVLDICRNAARYDLEMTLVSFAGGALEEDFRSSGVEYIPLHRRRAIDLGLARELHQIIVERDVRIVHAYQAVDGLHMYLATRRLPGVKRVLSFQGFVPDRKNRLTLRFLIPRMDANIVVSRGLQKYLEEVDGLDTSRNFRVLYNGADPERLRPTGSSLRAELELPDSSQLVGMTGSFYRDPRKDQMTVCRALPKVFERFPNAYCIFAGRTEPGAEEKFEACRSFCVEHGIDDRVFFLGQRSDVPDILAALDVFIFSSLHEGLPVAVSEAMLAGVPMIVSDIEPLLEATDNGRVAEVFPTGNYEVLASKLVTMLSDPERRAELGQLALDHARENFSIDAHLRNLTALYDALAKS